MAEIILEPTALSKVIPLSLKLNEIDSSLASQLVTNKQFNTADTDAWFSFTLDGLAATTGTFDLTLINLQDKSVFNHEAIAFNTNPFYYKLDSGTDELTNEIRHAGKWVGQLVVTLANGDSATRKFIFSIEGHILDGTVVQTILLEDYNALIADIEASKAELTQYNIDYASLIGTVTAQEEARVQAELTRTETFNALVDSEIIAQNVATELQNVEATYAPRLLSTEQQLAQAATKTALDVEKARIDSFTTLATGSTTGDAELIDGRVGIDGVIYPNIGGAVRGQLGQLKSALTDEVLQYEDVTSAFTDILENRTVDIVAQQFVSNPTRVATLGSSCNDADVIECGAGYKVALFTQVGSVYAKVEDYANRVNIKKYKTSGNVLMIAVFKKDVSTDNISAIEVLTNCHFYADGSQLGETNIVEDLEYSNYVPNSDGTFLAMNFRLLASLPWHADFVKCTGLIECYVYAYDHTGMIITTSIRNKYIDLAEIRNQHPNCTILAAFSKRKYDSSVEFEVTAADVYENVIVRSVGTEKDGFENVADAFEYYNGIYDATLKDTLINPLSMLLQANIKNFSSIHSYDDIFMAVGAFQGCNFLGYLQSDYSIGASYCWLNYLNTEEIKSLYPNYQLVLNLKKCRVPTASRQNITAVDLNLVIYKEIAKATTEEKVFLRDENVTVNVVDFDDGLLADDDVIIDRALEFIAQYKTKTLVFNTRNFNVSRAILIPSGTTVIVDGVTVKQVDGTFDNVFRSDNFVIDGNNPNSYPLYFTEELPDIKLIGKNGGTISKATVKATDGEGPLIMERAGWRGISVLFVLCPNIEVSGLSFVESDMWTVSFERCTNGYVHDLTFDTDILNADGVNLRVGCKDFVIENINGQTYDDTVALSATPRVLHYVPTVYPAVASYFLDKLSTDEELSIDNVRVSNIFASGSCRSVVCFSSRDGVVKNVLINNIEDKAARYTDELARYNLVKIYSVESETGSSPTKTVFENIKVNRVISNNIPTPVATSDNILNGWVNYISMAPGMSNAIKEGSCVVTNVVTRV